MDPMMRLGIQMSRWFRRPPSRQRLILMGVIVVLSLVVFAIERLYGWPSWMTVNGRMPRIPRHL